MAARATTPVPAPPEFIEPPPELRLPPSRRIKPDIVKALAATVPALSAATPPAAAPKPFLPPGMTPSGEEKADEALARLPAELLKEVGDDVAAAAAVASGNIPAVVTDVVAGVKDGIPLAHDAAVVAQCFCVWGSWICSCCSHRHSNGKPKAPSAAAAAG